MLEIVLWVLAGLVLVPLVLVAVGVLRLRGIRSRHRRRLAELQPEMTAAARLLGQASTRQVELRAVGTLALTADALVFCQIAPERETRIERSSITSATTTRHFLGKTTGSPLLVVTWEHLGAGDALAFEVADLEAWRTTLAP